MTDNRFAELTEEVNRLQERHDSLKLAIPKLEANKEDAVKELDRLNRAIAKAKDSLETLEQGIKERTDAYNTWSTDQKAKIDKLKENLAADRKTFEDDMVARQAKIKEEESAIEVAKAEIETAREAIKSKQTDINEQVKVNNKWAESHKGKDEEIKAAQTHLKKDQDALATKSAELDQREDKINGAEEEAKKLVTDAERDRQTARTLLANAKGQIGDLDARDQAQDMREKTLNDKERKLKLREIALNDRAGVLTSNGL